MSQRRSRSASVQPKGRRRKENKTVNVNITARSRSRGRSRTRRNIFNSTSVSAPVASQFIRSSRAANITHKPKGVRIAHNETLDDSVTGTSLFNVEDQWNINPGTSQLSWLNSQAAGFEYYRLKSMSLQYIPICSTATKGIVYMAFSYDPESDKPITEKQLTSLQTWKETPVWQGCVLNIDTKLAMGGLDRKYVRTFLTGAERRTSELGTMYVATQGMADTSTIGKIVLHYDFEFESPVTNLNNSVPVSRQVAMWKALDQAQTTSTAWLGIKWSVLDSIGRGWIGNLPIRAFPNGSGDYTYFRMPRGLYRFVCTSSIRCTNPGTNGSYAIRMTKNGVPLDAGTTEGCLANLAQTFVGTSNLTEFNLTCQGAVYSNGWADIFQFEWQVVFTGSQTGSIEDNECVVCWNLS